MSMNDEIRDLFDNFDGTEGGFFKNEIDRVYRNVTKDICANRHRENEQSVEAYGTARVKKSEARYLIMRVINQYQKSGSTCEEIEDETGLKHQSCSARISELKRDGLIRKIGTRPTRSGCQAAVYQAV